VRRTIREEDISSHSFVARVRAFSSPSSSSSSRARARGGSGRTLSRTPPRVSFWVIRAAVSTTTTTTCGDAIAIARDVMMACAHVFIIVARATHRSSSAASRVPWVD